MDLVLTGLGHEVDVKTGKAIFTAVFNRDIRIEVSKEAAETLTNAIYGNRKQADEEQEHYTQPQPPPDEPEVPQEEGATFFGGDVAAPSPMTLEDTPSSVYDEETGVEQV